MKFKNYVISIWAACTMLGSGCSLNTEPTDQISDQLVFNNIAMIDAVLQATYSKLKNETPGHMTQWATCLKLWSTSYGMDINADANQPYGNTAPLKNAGFYLPESYVPTEYASRGLWQVLYSVIYNTNAILASVDKVEGDKTLKDQIKGQALIMRARCYFDLIRIYQHTYVIAENKPGVPLRLLPVMEENMERATVGKVYEQITADLKNAETLLASFERPNLGYYDADVAYFILANVYLTMNKWPEAQAYANKIRVKYPLMTVDEYRNGFTTQNDEWVLGYAQTVEDSSRDNLGVYYNYNQNTGTMSYYALYPAESFVKLMEGDSRSLFIDHPTKKGKYAMTKFYDTRTSTPYGDMIDMRAAEMYLVEAEAAVRQGNTGLAKTVLNLIQDAREVARTAATEQAALLSAILLERRKEMYGEGLDYWDIKRLQLPVKKSIAQGNELDLDLPANTNRLTLMIPDQEVLNNKAIEQNPNPSSEPVCKP